MAIRPKILITGATDGIGQLAALRLAHQGADLILTARNPAKAAATVALIKAISADNAVKVYPVDFSDLASVSATGTAIARDNPRIDVMVNNAGVHAFTQRLTKDHFAEMIAVNYLAPWLLTRRLRDILIHSAPSRIITVGSQASRQSDNVDIDTMLTDTSQFTARGSSKIYARSKLLDIMFSLELARQLEGTGVAVNCLCPGFNVTSLGRELSFSAPLAKALKWLAIGNPERGAEMIVRLATDPEFGERSGAYVSVKNTADLVPTAPGNHEDARRTLWERTELLLARFG